MTETLGEVIRALRMEVNETQGTFADRFGYGRTHITEIENQRLSAENLRAPLIKQFPHADGRVKRAVDRYHPRDRRQYPPFREIQTETERLIGEGHLQAAVGLIEPFSVIERDGFRDSPTTDQSPWKFTERQWIYERLVFIYTSLGDQDRAFLASAALLVCSRHTEPLAVAQREIADNIANDWLHSALDIAERCLADYPTHALIWLQRSELYRVEQAWIEAYASATTAQSYRAPRHAVLRLRGQILAEWAGSHLARSDAYKRWGQERQVYLYVATNMPEYAREQPRPHVGRGVYAQMLDDVNAYLNGDIKDNVGSCEVLSARAYAHLACFDYDAAQGDFLLAEKYAKGFEIGIYYYRLGIYYEWTDNPNAALTAYEKAIASTQHALDIVRKRIAVDRISALRVTVT